MHNADDFKYKEDNATLVCADCGATARESDKRLHVCHERSLAESSANEFFAPAISPPDEHLASADSERPKFGENLEVLEVLGSGGMGTVYKVRDKALDKTFAVKQLRPELARDEANLKRFMNEIEAARQLTHANLCGIYSQGLTQDGSPYFLMECVEGESFAQILKRMSKLNSERVIELFIPICDALAHAHMKGVVHRDLKPSNIIVSKQSDAVEKVKVLDFGIAKLFPSAEFRSTLDLTRTGDVLGTPLYMSPEQCMGFKTDERSDIYALGCVMYEAASGSPPFAGDNPVQIIAKHLNELPQRFTIDQDKKQLKQLESLIQKCLAKSPEERFQNMDELRFELERVRDNSSNLPTDSFKARRYSGRRRRLVWEGAALVFMLFAGQSFLSMFDETADGDSSSEAERKSVSWDGMVRDLRRAVTDARKDLSIYARDRQPEPARDYFVDVTRADLFLEQMQHKEKFGEAAKLGPIDEMISTSKNEVASLKKKWEETQSQPKDTIVRTSLDDRISQLNERVSSLCTQVRETLKTRLPGPSTASHLDSPSDFIKSIAVLFYLTWTALVIRLGMRVGDAHFEERYQRRRDLDRFGAESQSPNRKRKR